MTYDDWKSTEPVQYEEPRHVCTECGSDLEDDGHDVACTFHPDYWEPPVRDYSDDEVTE